MSEKRAAAMNRLRMFWRMFAASVHMRIAPFPQAGAKIVPSCMRRYRLLVVIHRCFNLAGEFLISGLRDCLILPTSESS